MGNADHRAIDVRDREIANAHAVQRDGTLRATKTQRRRLSAMQTASGELDHSGSGSALDAFGSGLGSALGFMMTAVASQAMTRPAKPHAA